MEVIKTEIHLPASIEKLVFERIVGREKLKAYKALLRAAELTGVKQAKGSCLEDTQDMADYMLDIDVRLGELLKSLDKGTFKKGGETSLPSGVSKAVSHQTQTLAANQDIVEQVKAEARERGIIATTDKVYHLIKDKQKVDRAAEFGIVTLPTGKYRVFYADPPWKYTHDQHSKHEQETVLGTHYPSMSIPELCALDIKNIAEENAVLFLWVTSPLLEESFEVIKAWGFQYKSSMVWDKIAHNVGHYVSVRHEFILICTKGSCKPDNPKLYDSVLSIERTEHSKKPEEMRTIIDDLYPIGNRIELFARTKSRGWATYGNDPLL